MEHNPLDVFIKFWHQGFGAVAGPLNLCLVKLAFTLSTKSPETISGNNWCHVSCLELVPPALTGKIIKIFPKFGQSSRCSFNNTTSCLPVSFFTACSWAAASHSIPACWAPSTLVLALLDCPLSSMQYAASAADI